MIEITDIASGLSDKRKRLGSQFHTGLPPKKPLIKKPSAFSGVRMPAKGFFCLSL